MKLIKILTRLMTNPFSKMIKYQTQLSVFILLTLSPSAFALDGMFLSAGSGMNDTLIQYKSIRSASHRSVGVFWDNLYQLDNAIIGYSELELELYYSQISDQQKLNIIALRPVLNFWGSADKNRGWYWQFGVGVSYFDHKRLDPVELSTNAQFATIFGLGMPIDDAQQHRLTLRYNHYSNGYLKEPNMGLDTFSLDWHFRF